MQTGRPNTSKGGHIVLIHGSWMGGWSWEAVQAELEANGCASSAPTLAGLGDDVPPSDEAVGLGTHVAEMLAYVDALESGRIVVVGHSYGAMVAAAVADRRRDRVEQLIVVDGFLPESGKSIFDLRPDLAGVLKSMISPESPRLIQIPPASVLGLEDSPATDAAMLRMRPMPLGTHSEALALAAMPLVCRKSYILFEQCPFFVDTARLAAALGWTVLGVDAPHLGMMTHAPGVARALMDTFDSGE